MKIGFTLELLMKEENHQLKNGLPVLKALL